MLKLLVNYQCFANNTNSDIIIIIQLTRSETLLEKIAEIEPQPVALDFKNPSQYSSRFK